jgi:hypothetical protein
MRLYILFQVATTKEKKRKINLEFYAEVNEDQDIYDIEDFRLMDEE